MYYTVRHLTKFVYSNEISESIMETRMHPRSDEYQRCLAFQLSVSPRCRVFSYRDRDYWEFLFPSEFTEPTPRLLALADELEVRRRDDPLMLLHELNERLYRWFDYVPSSTSADSLIDVALEQRTGVCQDFAHIMLSLVRTRLRIPCRYVSGYLHHNTSNKDRSVSTATHAWIEALIPHLGWVGFDPTNWLIAGDRHIRTAIGRDYSDVPPTHGIFRGRDVTCSRCSKRSSNQLRLQANDHGRRTSAALLCSPRFTDSGL